MVKQQYDITAGLQLTVIDILLKSPDKVFLETIEPNWFGRYEPIVSAILAITGRGETPDKLSVSQYLGKGEVDIETAKILIEADRNGYGHPDNYKTYLESLKSVQRGEKIKNELMMALSSIEGGTKPDDAAKSVVEKLAHAMGGDDKGYCVNMSQGVAEYLERFEQAYEQRKTGGLGLKTGIINLDSSLGGLHPGDLMIVGARPGTGKTAFALTVTENLCRQNKRVGFFSIEMPRYQIMQRLFSLVSGVDSAKLRAADLSQQEYQRMTRAMTEIEKMPLLISDKPAMTTAEIMMRSRAWLMDGGLDAIVVDYLGRLKPEGKHENKNIEVGEIVSALKTVARTLEIPVICLAQLNRALAARASKEPTMSDLRDSGVIEQEADQILMLYRPFVHDRSMPPSEAKIIIEKNRHGEIAEVHSHFDPLTMRFTGKFSGYSEQ